MTDKQEQDGIERMTYEDEYDAGFNDLFNRWAETAFDGRWTKPRKKEPERPLKEELADLLLSQLVLGFSSTEDVENAFPNVTKLMRGLAELDSSTQG